MIAQGPKPIYKGLTGVKVRKYKNKTEVAELTYKNIDGTDQVISIDVESGKVIMVNGVKTIKETINF